MITVEAVTRLFPRAAGGPVAALDRLSFAAPAGAVTAVLGPNGAGKTTLFRVLAGLLRPDAGAIRVAGIDPAARPLEARARIGLLTEEPGLPDRLPAIWHVAMHAGLAGMGRRAARLRARRILDALGLDADLERPMGDLSRGTRAKVALARALARDPEILLLDEPTAHLDIETAAGVRATIGQRAAAGVTVLVATHDPHEAERLADRLLVLGRGRRLACDTIEALRGAAARGMRLSLRMAGEAAAKATAVSRLAWVGSVRASGDTLVIEARGPAVPQTALDDLMAATLPARILELRTLPPTLEEVYLDLQREGRR